MSRRDDEMKRGQEIAAHAFLRAQFDPDYSPEPTGYSISPEERARREAYRKLMRAGRGEDPDEQ